MDTIEQASKAAAATEQATINSRQRIADIRKRLKVGRAELAEAIANWQAAWPVVTRETLVREHIAAEQARKMAIARGEIEPDQRPQMGPPRSVQDAMGRNFGSEDSTGPRYGQQWRRGAFPATSRGRRVRMG